MRRRSLHVGLDRVEETNGVRQTSTGPVRLSSLNGAADARALAALTVRARFDDVDVLVDETATADLVLGRIGAPMQPGDLLVVSYAGHGRRVAGSPQARDDRDGYDETWELFDRTVLDDEIGDAIAAQPPGVQVIVISDSCHSGSVVTFDVDMRPSQLLEQVSAAPPLPPTELERAFPAMVLALSACMDTEEAAEWDSRGVLTSALTAAAKELPSAGTWSDWMSDAAARVRQVYPAQTPTLKFSGSCRVLGAPLWQVASP